MAHIQKIGGRIAVSSRKAGKAVSTPTDSVYPVTFDDGTQRDCSPAETVQLGVEEFLDWYKVEGESRFQQRHKDALLGWIYARGVLRDYELFERVSQSLGDRGLMTRPVSPESDFQAQVAAHDRDHQVQKQREERARHAITALQAKGVSAACPRCGRPNWSAEPLGLLVSQLPVQGLTVPPPFAPVIALTCTNCGWMSFHHLNVLGIGS